MANLWARKPLNMLLAEAGEIGRTQPEAYPRTFSAHRAGSGRGHWRGHLRALRTGRALCRAGPDALVCPVRPGMRLRGSLLRRIRRHDSPGRQRLHLCLRHPGRTVCLDHRLGPDARIRHGRQHRVFGLVEPLHRIAGYLPYQDAAVAGLRSLDRTAHRRKYCRPPDGAGFGLLACSRHPGLPQQSDRHHRGAVPATVGSGRTSCWMRPQSSESNSAGTCRPS